MSTENDNKKNGNLPISNVRQRLLKYLDNRIEYFTGDDLKSISESVRDEFLISELKKIKEKVIKGEI